MTDQLISNQAGKIRISLVFILLTVIQLVLFTSLIFGNTTPNKTSFNIEFSIYENPIFQVNPNPIKLFTLEKLNYVVKEGVFSINNDYQ